MQGTDAGSCFHHGIAQLMAFLTRLQSRLQPQTAVESPEDPEFGFLGEGLQELTDTQKEPGQATSTDSGVGSLGVSITLTGVEE